MRTFLGKHSEIFSVFPLSHEFSSLVIAGSFLPKEISRKLGGPSDFKESVSYKGLYGSVAAETKQRPLCLWSLMREEEMLTSKSSLFLTILCLSSELPLFEIGLTAWACVGTEVRFSGFELLA